MNKLSFTLLFLFLLSILAFGFYYSESSSTYQEIDIKNKSSHLDFIISNKCEISHKHIDFNCRNCNTASLSCKNFDITFFSNITHPLKHFFYYKNSASLTDLIYVFNTFYKGSIYKKVFNCSERVNAFDNITEVYLEKCLYDAFYNVTFEKSNNNLISVEKMSLYINLNKTTKENLIDIAREIYDYLLKEYYVNLTVPTSFQSASCDVNITEDSSFMKVIVCPSVLTLSINKDTNEVSVFVNIERFY